MATSLDEARRIATRVKTSDRVYQMGFNRRWARAYCHLKQQIDGGFAPHSANVKINNGDMLTPAWYTNIAISGGFMYDTAVRLVYIIDWLIGPITAVSALGRQSCIRIMMTLRCCSAAVAITRSPLPHAATPRERPSGTGRALRRPCPSRLGRPRSRAPYDTREPPRGVAAPSVRGRTDLRGYRAGDRAFVSACLGEAPPPVTVDDALHSIAVVDAAYASIARGGHQVIVPAE